MKRTALDFTRRLVGLKHVEARFDAVESRLGGVAYNVSQLLEQLGQNRGQQPESSERLCCLLTQAVDQQQADQRELLQAIREIAEGYVQERRTLKALGQQLGGKLFETANRVENVEAACPRTLEEYRRVVLYGGEPQIGHVLENKDALAREILTCRAIAADAFFIIGFARSGTSVSTDLVNNSIASAYVLSEVNFYIPKHIPDFYEWYGTHMEIQNTQISKASHLPNLIAHRSANWWEHLLALRNYYSLVGDKMALSALHFDLMPEARIQAFFEARFYNSKYLFLFRDPIATLLSWARLANFDSDDRMQKEIIAWLRLVRLWADMVRVFPNTLTLIRDDLGDDATERLGGFLEHALDKAFYRPNWTERPSIPDHFPSLKAHSGELMEIFSMVRNISHASQPLWKCDRFGVVANDPGIEAGVRAAMSRQRNGPIGEPCVRAERLIEQLTEMAPNSVTVS
jgi:hypothetical protein